ncbi:MAG: hypothetical protein AAGA96_00655 [Verrucomicrobiota bacterium]
MASPPPPEEHGLRFGVDGLKERPTQLVDHHRTIAEAKIDLPLTRSALFPSDKRSELSESIRMSVEEEEAGILVSSGRLVAMEEDYVFRKGKSDQLGLLRPPRAAITIGGESYFYGEALRFDKQD